MTVAIALAYLLAAVLFIIGLIQLSSPRSARRGNQIAAVGMVIALLATIPLLHFTGAGIAITVLGLLIGVPIGAVAARQVKMTAIPQMVALFNGVGGGAAALVAVSELLLQGSHPPFALAFPSVFSIVIGSVSFASSMVAFGVCKWRRSTLSSCKRCSRAVNPGQKSSRHSEPRRPSRVT